MTIFYQVADNASGIAVTDLSTTGITGITLESGQGSLFPQPGNGFICTLWNSSIYGTNPGADPNMEKVTCSARSGNTLTVTATTKAHPAPCTVAILVTSQITTQLQGAVNALEATVGTLVSDRNYTQAFSSVSSVTVTHNLNKYPAITIVDTAGDEVRGDVVFNSVNQVTVSFSAPFSGTVYCN